jgi:hypothetical protein
VSRTNVVDSSEHRLVRYYFSRLFNSHHISAMALNYPISAVVFVQDWINDLNENQYLTLRFRALPMAQL